MERTGEQLRGCLMAFQAPESVRMPSMTLVYQNEAEQSDIRSWTGAPTVLERGKSIVGLPEKTNIGAMKGRNRAGVAMVLEHSLKEMRLKTKWSDNTSDAGRR